MTPLAVSSAHRAPAASFMANHRDSREPRNETIDKLHLNSICTILEMVARERNPGRGENFFQEFAPGDDAPTVFYKEGDAERVSKNDYFKFLQADSAEAVEIDDALWPEFVEEVAKQRNDISYRILHETIAKKNVKIIKQSENAHSLYKQIKLSINKVFENSKQLGLSELFEQVLVYERLHKNNLIVKEKGKEFVKITKSPLIKNFIAADVLTSASFVKARGKFPKQAPLLWTWTPTMDNKLQSIVKGSKILIAK